MHTHIHREGHVVESSLESSLLGLHCNSQPTAPSTTCCSWPKCQHTLRIQAAAEMQTCWQTAQPERQTRGTNKQNKQSTNQTNKQNTHQLRERVRRQWSQHRSSELTKTDVANPHSTGERAPTGLRMRRKKILISFRSRRSSTPIHQMIEQNETAQNRPRKRTKRTTITNNGEPI